MSIIKNLIFVVIAQYLEPYSDVVMIVAAVIVVGFIVWYFWKLKDYKKEPMEHVDENMKCYQALQRETQGLMVDVLNSLGCQPTKNEDGTLDVSYQGENFRMEFGGRFARVLDPMWSWIKVDDPDLPQIREAVNAANFCFGPTVVMTAPDEEGIICLHSRRDIMLHPACPDNVPYVKAVLDSFFEMKENVRMKFQQLNARQADAHKSRRPVGFSTNVNTNNSEEEK